MFILLGTTSSYNNFAPSPKKTSTGCNPVVSGCVMTPWRNCYLLILEQLSYSYNNHTVFQAPFSYWQWLQNCLWIFTVEILFNRNL